MSSSSVESLGSRFQGLLIYNSTKDLRLKVQTQFLSPNVTYVINLVYKRDYPRKDDLRIPFKYKLEEMRTYYTSCVAHVGEDGWRRTQLFQFTSTKKEHYFEIQFSSEMKGWDYFSKDSFSISVEGVEFCPVDFEIDDENKVNIQPPDIEWAERLPFKWSKGLMSQEEVYFAFRKGLYINDSQQWFSISKKSKKRLMLPARAILQEEKLGLNLHSLRKSWIWKAQPAGSRFKEAAECSAKNRLAIAFQIEGQLLSPETIYACYLVFKLPANDSVFEGIVMTSFETPSSSKEPATIERHIYLLTPPNTPIIDQSYGQIPSRTRKIKGHPKLRKDGWMEIQVWEFVLGSSSNYFWMNGHLKSLNKWKFTGLLVQGIELRPAKVSWNYSNSVLL